MKSTVRIDQVDVADLSAQPLRQFQRAAGQCLSLTWLAGANRGDHVGVTRVEHHAIVGTIHLRDNPHDVRWLIEGEPRLEFPHYPQAFVLSVTCALLPCRDNSLTRGLLVHFVEDCWRLNRVHPN